MGDLVRVFKKVNGKKVIKDYTQAHVLFHAIVMTAVQGTSKKSLEIVRESVNNKIVKRLREEYRYKIYGFKEKIQSENLSHERCNKVWVCWLQGMENAPEIVKKCYQSLQKNLTDREIIFLTNDNYKSLVQFPDYIQKKIDDGLITRTHMTDLLRLELLEHYGGTWIDATVFCSGNNIPNYIWDSDLFIYQCMKPGLDGHARRVSSWFITACTNHPIILTKKLLYEYWKDNNKLIDYFLIHDFVEIAIETFPEEWMKVVPVSNSIPHILLLRLSDKYNDKVWRAVKDMTPFHKLSYKINYQNMESPNTYYSKIIDGGKVRWIIILLNKFNQTRLSMLVPSEREVLAA